jgi:predicted small secreted protein
MKKLVANRFIIALFAVVITAVLFSSCNRGYGCPYKMTAKAEVKK